MTTATAPSASPAPPVSGPGPKIPAAPPVFVERIRIDDCDWETYERFLLAIGDRPLRCTYDRGRLEIMAPMRFHEREKSLLSSMIDSIALMLKHPLEPCGSMTIRREDLRKGFEPDACFYFAHAQQMIAVDEPDFTTDPPPDLAIEVDITSSSIDRQSLYATLGIPELWRFTGTEIEFHLLQKGAYQLSAVSQSFPFLSAADVNRYLALVRVVGHIEILQSFRTWLLTVIPSSGA